jgi:outer membrane receptor protein involved in Fe transport
VATISLPITRSDGWFITPGCQLRFGSTYADHANQLSYGGTALFSLELGRRQADGWSAILGIHNLFDRDAIASTAGVIERAASPDTTSIFLPANGRTFSLRIEHVW